MFARIRRHKEAGILQEYALHQLSHLQRDAEITLILFKHAEGLSCDLEGGMAKRYCLGYSRQLPADFPQLPKDCIRGLFAQLGSPLP